MSTFARRFHASRWLLLVLAGLCSTLATAEPATPAVAAESFGGVGARLQADGRYARVFELVPGGPAAASGQLQVGDRIIGVGEQSGEIVNVIAMPLPDLVSRIRGPVGSQVRLQVLAPDTEDLARARVVALDWAVVIAPAAAAAEPAPEVSAVPAAPAEAPAAGDIAAQCAKKYAAMKACEQIPSLGATVCKSQVNKTYKHLVCSLIQ